MPLAASFAALATDPGALVRPLTEAAAKVTRPAAGFVFVSGVLARDAHALAHEISQAWPGVPALVAPGAGVLTERGEYEGQSAAAGLLTGGLSATPFVASGSTTEELGAALETELTRASGGRPGTAVLFVNPSLWSPLVLEGLGRALPHVRLVGGGTSGESSPLVVDEAGRTRAGQVAGLLLRGPGAPRVAISPGCRLLGELFTVTEVRGSMVLRLNGRPALDVLSRAAQGLEGRPLVLALLPDPSRPLEESRRAPMKDARVRPIRGVDPSRKGIVLGETTPEGALLGFAVLDGPQARAHLEATLRELGRETAGAEGRFGLYINCAGRGAGLHGSADVDSKMLHARFERLPIAGVMSAFEIAPVPPPAAMHFYTGVFALFTAPS